MWVGFSCPVNAKNGSHNTYLSEAAETGRLSILVNSQAIQLLANSDGRVTGVRIGGTDDDRAWSGEVTADEIVLSAGAIETARLLLNSTTSREPDGIGNNFDQVGRHLQGHVYAGATGVFEDSLNVGLGPGPSIATTDFRHDNPGIIGGGMLANEFVPTPVSALAYLQDAGLLGLHGPDMTRSLAHLLPRFQRVVGTVQEVTSATSRVTLNMRVLDSFGAPAAHLSSGLHAEDLRARAFLNEKGRRMAPLKRCRASDRGLQRITESVSAARAPMR